MALRASTLGRGAHSRHAGFPIYYSYVAPSRDATDSLISELDGKWFILYYVLAWQRWLIADARKGATHGGLGFTGDTLEEFVKALHQDGARNGTWRFQVLALVVGTVDSARVDGLVHLACDSCHRVIGWRARVTSP